MTTLKDARSGGGAGRGSARAVVRDPAFSVWVVLMVATLVSWYLGEGHGAREAATVGVIVVAFLKVYLVGRYFMELREAPAVLRLVFAVWAAGMAGALSVIYLVGGG